METRHGMKYRQLHIEDYLGEIPAEQGRGTGVYAHEWITGNPDTNGRTTCLMRYSEATILMPHTKE